MARGRWLTPDTGDGTTVARCISVPLEYLPVLNGALETMCYENNWEEFGDISADDAALTMRGVVDAYYESEDCNMPTFPDRDLILWYEGKPSVGNVLTMSISTAEILNGHWSQFPSAINDEMLFDVLIDAGTYDLTIVGVKSSASGIMTWAIDGVEDANTIDLYNATQIRNQVVTISVVVPLSGEHIFKCKMKTKNASSSGYDCSINYFKLFRTGD